MSDFLSISPAPDTVTINGKKVDVYGISMIGFAHLIPRFPSLISQLQARFEKDGNLTVPGIMEVAGDAIGAILAAGLGHPGNEDAEKRLSQLGATEQLKVLHKIAEKTMPDGLGPFVGQWASLMQRFAAPQPQKMRFKILQTESKVSSGSADTAEVMSGT